MPADIFGERFLGRREPAWHGLGQVFTEPMTATEAISAAGVDFSIDKVPTFAMVGAGTWVKTGDFAIVRPPVEDDATHRVLGTVGRDWTPIQAVDLARIVDPITERFPVETVGALGHGERMFLVLDAGDCAIAGEAHKFYYLLTDDRRGGRALTMAGTPVRVVCQNTLSIGLSASRVRVDLTHTPNIVSDVEFYTSLFSQMMRAKDQTIDALNRLSERSITSVEADRVIRAAYPDIGGPTQRLKFARGLKPDDVSADVWTSVLGMREAHAEQRDKKMRPILRLREAAAERYAVFNDQFHDLSETAWAVYQAVCEVEDYRKGHKAEAATVFGHRAEAKVRAFNAASSLG